MISPTKPMPKAQASVGRDAVEPQRMAFDKENQSRVECWSCSSSSIGLPGGPAGWYGAACLASSQSHLERWEHCAGFTVLSNEEPDNSVQLR